MEVSNKWVVSVWPCDHLQGMQARVWGAVTHKEGHHKAIVMAEAAGKEEQTPGAFKEKTEESEGTLQYSI